MNPQHLAQQDYEIARRKAFLTAVGSLLSRQPNQLFVFDEFMRQLPVQGQIYRGVREVPLAAIRGSVDRYRDFDRNFLPSQTNTRPRWTSIDAAMIKEEHLPPIQLYQLGGLYFVKDGNHRVSVARERGQDIIDAEVIEITTPVPPAADMDLRDLLALAEYGRFLQQTNLDKLRPGAKITFSALGRYDTLLEHISAHRWYLGINERRAIGWDEAVQSWYDTVYLPMIETIRRLEILGDFPGRTEADLYLWIMEHRWYLGEQAGHPVGPVTAALSYDLQYAGQATWGRRVARGLQRLLARAARPFVLSGRLLARAGTALYAAEGRPHPPPASPPEPGPDVRPEP